VLPLSSGRAERHGLGLARASGVAPSRRRDFPEGHDSGAQTNELVFDCQENVG
jgi:hypothetical protein